MNYSWKHGHTKGFLLLDKSQGFWVIHSIPEFPPFPQKGYQYPPTGQKNGQTAICLTFQYDQFAKIDLLPRAVKSANAVCRIKAAPNSSEAVPHQTPFSPRRKSPELC
ncbi:UNVERIFIED_CONTAM: Deoxyribonuclease-2-beta [Gekko kuhli]